MPNEPRVMLDRKLWLTDDRDRLVEDGDPDARFLFGVAGRKVSGDDCKRLGYRVKGASKAADALANKESKAAANKGGKKPANKGDK